MSGITVKGFQKFRTEEVRDKFVKGAAKGKEADMLRTAVRNAVLSAVDVILPPNRKQVGAKMFFTKRNTMTLKPKQIGVDTGESKKKFKESVAKSIKGKEKVTRNRVAFEYEYNTTDSVGYLIRKRGKKRIYSGHLEGWVATKLGKASDREIKDTAYAIARSWSKKGQKKIADEDAFNVLKNPYANEIFTKHLEKNMAGVIAKFKERYLNAIKKQYK
jgi:hypothetical protein